MPISAHFKWTLPEAYAFWAAWKNKDAETIGVQERLDSAEAFLLEAEPSDLAEAIVQIEVAQHNLIDGGRSDGLDLDALDNALGLLRRLVLSDHLVHRPASLPAQGDRPSMD